MNYEPISIESSFKKKDIGQTLYDLVLDLKPKKIVEFGVLHGYATVAMAMALDKLGKGHIEAYDLWQHYQFRHSTMLDTQFNISAYGLESYVDLYYGDFWEWEPTACDMVMLDISNDGDILKRAVEKLKGYAQYLVFEGGTVERDMVEWMTKYDKTPMSTSGVKYEVLNHDFPGLSIIKL